jgi:hypothetical protein
MIGIGIFILGGISGIVIDRLNLSNYIRSEQAVISTPTPLEELPGYDVNVEDLIHITSPQELEEKRSELLEYIRGEPGLSDALPTIESDIVVDQLPGYRVDHFIVEMPEGMWSNSYFVHASGDRRNRLIIYHTGHEGGISHHYENVSRLADSGYDVVMMFMPLVYPNPPAQLETDCCGPLSLMSHNQLIWLEHPILPFVEPVTVVLNYADQQDYAGYYMVGLSGGAWTTTLYAAIDPRIRGSFPAAGSLPLFLRIKTNNIGDYEQLEPELYQRANYLEQYVMGAYGEGRFQVQILNKFDPCCWDGELYRLYEPTVRDRVNDLGEGDFSVFSDTSHREHKLSEQAMKMILDRIENSD